MASNSTEDQDLEERRLQIQEWLAEDRWKVRKDTSDDAVWLLVAEDDAGRKIMLGQMKGFPDLVVIQADLTIGENDQQSLSRLDASERDEFLWDLRLALLRFGVEFNGISDPLQRVALTHRIYEDGLTKDRLMGRVLKIKDALVLTVWMLQRKLAQQPQQVEGIPTVQ